MSMHDRNLTDPDIMSKIFGVRPGTRRWPDRGGPIMQVVAVMQEEYEDRHLIITAAAPHAATI